MTTDEILELVERRDAALRKIIEIQRNHAEGVVDLFDSMIAADSTAEIATIQCELNSLWKEGEKEALLAKHKEKVRNFLEHGVNVGWWCDFDRVKVDRPKPNPIIFQKSSFPEGATMAHVFSHERVKIFESVGEAKRNGWNRPITYGTFEFKKKGVTVVIE